ncbi:hypothetical protein BHE74_00050650 [Ensete ventricosum]|nr:hypothetical protein GW17_00036459 [Ensete ventricosum]RWW43656.1 hypothetical protein BHE74_00050650 [Ensete ventricosum]RZS05450.1 hypothetical protein BHM03_00035968 [Ensete ventricosum]
MGRSHVSGIAKKHTRRILSLMGSGAHAVLDASWPGVSHAAPEPWLRDRRGTASSEPVTSKGTSVKCLVYPLPSRTVRAESYTFRKASGGREPPMKR